MARWIRGIAKIIAMAVAATLYPVFLILGLYAKSADRFSDVTLPLAYVPGRTGEVLRGWFYKTFLRGGVGTGTVFKFGSYCQYTETHVGSRCSIGTFNALGLVSIGDDVLTGSGVNFVSGTRQHAFDDPGKTIRSQSGSREPIRIGSDVWIGSNSIICASVGDRVVVGAGSVVTEELGSHGIYAGNRAQHIRDLP
jgi:acetyltransferase-like isoleucine patch superfamily enzyme